MPFMVIIETPLFTRNYWVAADEQLRMLYAYAKSKQENLTPEQLTALRKIAERWNS